MARKDLVTLGWVSNIFMFSPPLCVAALEIGEDEDDGWGSVCTYRSREYDCKSMPHISHIERMQAGSSLAARALHVNCSSGNAGHGSKMQNFIATAESHKWAEYSVVFDEDPTAELSQCKNGDTNYIACTPGISRRLWLAVLPGDLVNPGIFSCGLIQNIIRILLAKRNPSRPNGLGHWSVRNILHFMESQHDYVDLVGFAQREKAVARHRFFEVFEDWYANFKLMLAKHLMRVYQILQESLKALQPTPLNVLIKSIAGRFERMLSEVFSFQQNFGMSQCLTWIASDQPSSANDIRLRMDQQVSLEQMSTTGLYIGRCKARTCGPDACGLPSLAYQYHDLPGPRWQILHALIQRLRTESSSAYINVVEIGVASGNTADQLLRHCDDINYTGVDSYTFEDKNIVPWINQSSMLSKLKQFPDRARHLHATSVVAARHIPNASVDLIFIDANHSFDGVLEDIETWMSKVRSGGVLAGHDFNVQHSGVIAAVMTLALRINSVINLSADATWWIPIP